MSKSKFNPLIAASVVTAVYLSGISNDSRAMVPTLTSSDIEATTTESFIGNGDLIPSANAQGQRRYIIQFHQPSVAFYDGGAQFAPIPRLSNHKIDVKSPAVQSYVSMLENEQNNFINGLASQFGRNVDAIASYKYAVNGVALYLSAEEASIVKNNANVKSIDLDRNYFLDTDVGPTLIGANNVWEGNEPSTGQAFGEGVVFGIIDSGANFDHPSFADVGGDGYDHTNPLGSGNYLGACDSGNADQYIADYTCNDKLIGGYDFVSDVTDPDGTEVVGPEDENGHGTHTASTAGGNLVLTASANGVENIEISGVARHANIVVYDACFTTAAGRGTCPGVSLVSSIDQVIADGIIDVVNYSISGGTSPWTDTVSQGFLAATDNGIFVSASAGNSGPGAATLGHVEPWTSTVGASTHTRGFETLLSITDGPSPIGPEVTDIEYRTSDGPSFAAPIVAGIQYSENIDAANVEACNAFPADSFLGLVALVSRGSCSFEDKINNASAAGAIAVIVHNDDRAIAFGMVTGTTTVPSISIPQADGLALRDYINEPVPPVVNGGGGPVAPEVTIANPVIINSEQADVMADFSSRGPSPFEVNKPDVTAPGVNILAAFNDNEVLPGSPDEEYGIISGTSMSSPHNAGAAALLKELQPTWTVPEIKSALMMTAKTAGVTKEDGVTPSDAFDRGAGRIQVDVASSTGLVMDESAFDFLLADPANGGDPKTLNLASYKNDDCEATCTFERTFRSVSDSAQTYDAAVTGLTATVSPSSFTVLPGQLVTLEVSIDGAASPIGETSFGELSLTAQTPNEAEPQIEINDDDGGLDDAYDGTLATMACTDVTVSGVPFPASPALEVELGMTHTWAGDLVVKLINPNGDTLGLMSRTGFAETADDGTGGFGDSSNLLATSPITFSDTASASAEDMGNSIGNDEVICQDDAICDFIPAPDTVAGVTTLADMLVTDPNGTWQMCVGDSGGGDTGSFESVAFNFAGVTVSTPPTLNSPLVIIGYPDQPIIDVSPAEINETLSMGNSTDVTVNISNSGLVADLNWSFSSGTFETDFVDQLFAGANSGYPSGSYAGNGGAALMTGDDFTLSGQSTIEAMSFDGFVNGNTFNAQVSGVRVFVYADDNGTPAGFPGDGLDLEVFSLDIPNPDPSLVIDGGVAGTQVNIDVTAANGGTAPELPAGTYWAVLVVDQVSAIADSSFFWLLGGEDTDDSAGSFAHAVGPLFGLPEWAVLSTDVLTNPNPAFEKMSFSVSGSGTCGASWITTSPSTGTVGSAGSEDVVVTLDSTGVAEGTYNATLCIDNDDFDKSQVLVPVTLTVGPSDLIFENGFEAPPAP